MQATVLTIEPKGVTKNKNSFLTGLISYPTYIKHNLRSNVKKKLHDLDAYHFFLHYF